MKCKKCAGDLPHGAYGKVKCEYCGTINSVPTPEQERERKVEIKEARSERKWVILLFLLVIGGVGAVVGYQQMQSQTSAQIETTQELAKTVERTVETRIDEGKKDDDGDGISNADDQCDNKPEDFDGYMDTDGCPDTDNDGDGIADSRDSCPKQAENFDGYKDSDGCPEPNPNVEDDDGDGISNANDQCPTQKEDMDGYKDTDGCPDIDNDGDGILDINDACPNKAENFDGYKDSDGCPEPNPAELDDDRDGIKNKYDQCPNQPEDKDGFQDSDGCPDSDNDGDGILDVNDNCPNKVEVFNGYRDVDGCWDDIKYITCNSEEIIDGSDNGGTHSDTHVDDGIYDKSLEALLGSGLKVDYNFYITGHAKVSQIDILTDAYVSDNNVQSIYIHNFDTNSWKDTGIDTGKTETLKTITVCTDTTSCAGYMELGWLRIRYDDDTDGDWVMDTLRIDYHIITAYYSD